MTQSTKLRILIFSLIVLPIAGYAQSISGTIRDDNHEPVPFVHVFFQELNDGTVCNAEGKYYFRLNPGSYRMVVSAMGFEKQMIEVHVGDGSVVQDVWLVEKVGELGDVVVKAKRRDPAFEIIRLVIENKNKYIHQIPSLKSQLYIKAIEEVDITKPDKPEKPKKVKVGLGGEADPFSEEEKAAKKEQLELARLGLAEMQMTFNYEAPDHFKEERHAVKRYGDQHGLFLPSFTESNFNFYKNLLYFPTLTNNPVISPISRTALVSYKYELIESKMEDSLLVHKIKVTPRKSGNSTVSGILYINEGLWNINRLELSLPKGGLKFYDRFVVKQDYSVVGDSLWFPTRQEYNYRTRQGKKRLFRGNTVMRYDSLQPNYVFPHKFFGVEVAVTTKEAYLRDSTYWNETRPEPLTVKQQKMMHYRDSIKAAREDPKFLDSLDAAYNKITLGDLTYAGVGFQNHHKKRRMYFSSLVDLIEFEVVGGWRLGPSFSHFKRWKSGRYLSSGYFGSIGLKNGDTQGSGNFHFRYDPFRQGDIGLSGGRSFFSLNPYDAILNQLSVKNFILNDNLGLNHRIELFNGFYLKNSINWRDRRPISGLDASSFLNEWISDEGELVFENYQAFITETQISYTPKQRYMREPNRKVVLGSKYPTFSAIHRKGWAGPFGSDVDFDYVAGRITQNLLLGTLGSSKITFESGKFVNTNDLRLVDVKRFRQSDPWLYSDPRWSFQLLDTSLIAKDLFYEFHLIHHFNGALINNLPLIKKTKISLVGGGGALWVKESNYRHEELFAGVERIFKIGARRRLKVGFFGVIANSNHTPIKTDFKIALDIIDVWKKQWTY